MQQEVEELRRKGQHQNQTEVQQRHRTSEGTEQVEPQHIVELPGDASQNIGQPSSTGHASSELGQGPTPDPCASQRLPLTPSNPTCQPQSPHIVLEPPEGPSSTSPAPCLCRPEKQDEFPHNDSRVYGITSLLHNTTPATATAAFATPTAAEIQQAKTSQHELVSTAAINRQEEMMLRSEPGLLQHVDFDGVPMDLAMHLVDLHWNRQHLSYLLTYRPAMMYSLIHGGPHMNKLLLNAIFFSTCLYDDIFSTQSEMIKSRTSPRGFYNRIKTLLVDYMDKPTMPTIVALLLCGSSLVPYGEQGMGWLFCGMAYRMIFDLGYHLDAPASLQGETISATELEIRKRVYWGAYVCDTFQSLYLGRQPSLYRIHSTISSDYLDIYEEMENWKPFLGAGPLSGDIGSCHYHGSPTFAVSTFSLVRQLCTIANSIIETFYSNTCHAHETIAYRARDEIRARLEKWRQMIPSKLQFEPGFHKTPPPHQITPQYAMFPSLMKHSADIAASTTYWTLVILTEQPFLKIGQFDFTPDASSQEAARTRCTEAALKIWKILEAYEKAFTFRRAQYGISYAAYCAVLIMLQHAPQDQAEYFDCIQFFWKALLDHQKGCSQGLKRPLQLLKSLMQRVESVRHRRPNTSNDTVTQQAAPSMNGKRHHIYFEFFLFLFFLDVLIMYSRKLHRPTRRIHQRVELSGRRRHELVNLRT